MSYRVSTTPSGDKLWWGEHDQIPTDHTAVRPATEEETALMDRIVKSKNPPVAWGARVAALMQQTA